MPPKGKGKQKGKSPHIPPMSLKTSAKDHKEPPTTKGT